MAIDDAISGSFDPSAAIDDLISQQSGQSATGVSPNVLADRLYRKMKDRPVAKPDDAPQVQVQRPTNLKPKEDDDLPDFSDQGVAADKLPDFSDQGTPADQMPQPPAPTVALGTTGQAKAALKGILHAAVEQSGSILKGMGALSAQADRETTPEMMASVAGGPPELQPTTLPPPVPTAQQPYYRAGQAVQQFADRNIPMTPQENDSMGGRIGQGIGGVAPYIAAGAINPALGVAAGGVGMGLSATGDAYDAAIAKGATEEQAAKAASLSGLAAGALGTVPLGMVLKPIRIASPAFAGKAATILEEAVKNGVTFAGVGEAQEYLLQKIAQMTYDPQAGYSPDAKRVMASLITGGILGAGGHFMERRARATVTPDDVQPDRPLGLGGPGTGPGTGSADPGAEPSGGPSPGGPGETPPPRPEAERSGVGREKLEKILRYYGYSAADIAAMSHAEMSETVLREMKGAGPQAKPAPEQPQPEASSKPGAKPQAEAKQSSSTGDTEREGLKRYGWSDDEIDAMSPAQRRREFQDAMSTGQSEPQPQASDTTKKPETATASSPDKVVSDEDSTGFKAGFKNMASGMGESLRDYLWDLVQAGKTREATGATSPMLQGAKMLRARGGLQTRDQFVAYAEDHSKINAKGPDFQKAMRELVLKHMPGDGSGKREDPIVAKTASDIERAQPVEPKSHAQAEAENFQHSHVELPQFGLEGDSSISVETGLGQTRNGPPGPDGKPKWSVKMTKALYGRIKGSMGADGQPLDIFVGPHPDSPHIFVIDQHHPQGGFDEHKIMAGFKDPQSALHAYRSSYTDHGVGRIGHVVAMGPEEFKQWLASDTTVPLKKGEPAPLDVATGSGSKVTTSSTEAAATSTAAPKETPTSSEAGANVAGGSNGATREPAKRSSEPMSLLQFIASKGGLAPHPELSAIGLHGDHRVQIPGRRGFFGVLRPTGDKLDMIREAAEEAGYLRGEHNKTSTIRNLLDAIDTELRGGRHAAEGEEGHTTKREHGSLRDRSAAARDKAIEAAREDIAAEYSDVPEDLLDRAAEIMADERLDIDSAVEMAAVRMVAEDQDYGVSAQDLEDIYGEDVSDAIRPRPASEDGGSVGEQRPSEQGSGEGEETSRDGAHVQDLGGARREEAPAGSERKATAERDRAELTEHTRAVEKALGADADKVAPVDIARAAEIMVDEPGIEPEDAFGQAVIKNAVEQGFLTEQQAVDAYGEEVREILEPGREGASGGSAHADEGGAEPDTAVAGGAEESGELPSSSEAGARKDQDAEKAAEAENASGEAKLASAEAARERALRKLGQAEEALRRKLGRPLKDADYDHPDLTEVQREMTLASQAHTRAVRDQAYDRLAPTMGDKYRLVRTEDDRSRWSAPARELSDRLGIPADVDYSMEVVRNSDGAVVTRLQANGNPISEPQRETLRAVQANEDVGSAIEYALKEAESTLPQGDNVSVLHKPDMSDVAAQLEDASRHAPGAGKVESLKPAVDQSPEDWWKELTVSGRKDLMEQAGISRPARVLWKYLSADEQSRLIEFKGEGGDRGISSTIPTSDAAAGPEAVQPAQAGGEVAGAGRGEGQAGERAVRGADEGRAEGTGRVSEGAVRERGDGAGAPDADRLSEPRTDDAAERREKRATERAANLVEGENHTIEPGSLEENRTPKNKALGNINALELANQILAEDRPATAAEQQILAQYVGWGGLKNAFPDAQGNFSDDMFHTIGNRLQAALSPEEYRTARRSIQYAHYTAEKVVRSMWDAVERLGFKGGQVFEPGMGTGNFAGMMPADIAANSHYSGIELDHTTARIAKLLYPKWGIRQDDFTNMRLPADTFDLVIGNPPFADIAIKSDPNYKQGFLLHDYFFAKSLDAVRPGGLLAFVTSAGTMNKFDASAREYLADRADFVGGIRLPGDAFKKNAGTEVTTDILFLRKRLPGDVQGDRSWTETKKVELPDSDGRLTPGNASRYFSEHPEMVLGKPDFADKLYQGRYSVKSVPGQDLATDLARAIERLPQDVISDWQNTQADSVKADFTNVEKKEGTYYVGPDGNLHQVANGVGMPVKQRGKGVEGGRTAAEIERIKGLVPVRDALREVYAADLAGDTGNAQRARESLNRHYDAFVEKFGPINKAVIQTRRPNVIQMEGERQQAREDARYAGVPFKEGSFDDRRMVAEGASTSVIARERQKAREAAGDRFDEGSFDPNEVPDVVIDKRPNVDAFMDDPESYRLRAIERYNEGTGEAHKSPVFFENVITREKKPEINSTNDALLYSLSKFGRVDIPEMAALLRKSPGEVIDQLGGQIFQTPGTADTFETRDEYLSGNVRKKLALAKKAAERNPAFRRNVDALEAAQPTPLPPSQIHASLGMPWIPQATVSQFGTEALGLEKLNVRYLAPLAQWVVNGDTDSVSASSTWGTVDRRAPALVEDALNRRNPKIYDKIMVDGRESSVLNIAKTEAAQDKVKAIQEKFAGWLWEDEKRADELAGMYNEKLNNLVVREYDGEYLTTPGISAKWSWRPHQKRVIARIIQSGNTYVAHAVGAGKTSEYIGAIMEMRRLGLVRKPMVTVPNHMLAQFTKEWYEQYPTAKLSIADERQFHTDKRKQFIANVANDDLDAVIITHSAFGMIPVSDKFQNSLIANEIAQYRDLMSQLQGGDNRITRSRIEKQIERLEQRLQGKGTKRKDSVFTFEEMGIDHLTVDEAHLFRKLDFSTQMSNLKGVSPEGSGMAWDLYVKAQYLDKLRPGRSLVLGSGTPITNTMAELYSLQRFMQPQVLAERGLEKFDAWAGAFGESVSELEQDAAGNYKPVSRFAKFVNVAELSAMVRQVMDVVTSKQLEQYVTRPAIKGGKRQMHLAEKSEELEAYQEQLAERMTAIQNRKGPPAKGDDIMLTVINDGRHAAIDMRLAGGGKSSSPSKLDMMIDNVFKRWQETKNQPFHRPAEGGGYEAKPAFRGPGTQLLFTNLGLSGARGFAVPDYIRAELTRRGVPKDDIAYIYDYKNQTAKQRLFNDMNEGKKRILIGSVAKMGVGTNVQRRLTDIHNMDPLWYPADDEQRNGRGVRQGNMNPEIGIHDYSTKGTYDSAMWGMMAKKAKFIQGFFEGDPNLREMDDLGEASQYEQAKALTTNDPRLIRFTELRQELERATRRKTAFDSEVYATRQRRAEAKSQVEHYSQRIEETKADIAQRVDTTGDAFKAKVGKKTFDKRSEFTDELWTRTGDLLDKGVRNQAVHVGEIGGFPIWAEVRKAWTKEGADFVDMWLQMNGKDVRREVASDTPRGAVQSMEMTLRNLPSDLQEYQARLAKAQKFFKESEAKANAKFEGQAEINQLARQVRELEAELKGGDKPEKGDLSLPANVMEGMTPEAQGLVASIENLLKDIVRRVAGDSVAVHFDLGAIEHEAPGYGGAGSNKSLGIYSPSRALIRLALMPGKADIMAQSAYHESYHHIENRLQTDQERRLMKSETPRMREWIKGKTGFTDKQVDGLAGYEVRAIAFQLYSRFRDNGTAQQKASGAGIHMSVRRWFERLMDILRKVANGLRGMGFKRWEDIFRKADEGGFADRKPTDESKINTDDMAASWNIFRRQQDDAIGSRIKDLMASTAADRFVERYQNLSKPVQRLEEAVEAKLNGTLPDSQAFYQKKRLFPGKVAATVQDFNKAHLDPLIKAAKDGGLTLPQVGDILYALHAPERNAAMEEINHPALDRSDADVVGRRSGMSDEEAAQILAQHDPALVERIDRLMQGIRDFNLDMQVESGLLAAGEANNYRSKYQHYVPLSGWDVAPEDQDRDQFKGGGAFNVRGKESQRAFGRKSKAQNPLVNALEQSYRTVERAKKNEYLRSLRSALGAVEPDDLKGFVRFDQGKPKKVVDPMTGLVMTAEDPFYRNEPGAVGYKVGGNQRYMIFDNAETGEAIKRMHADGLGLFQPLLNVQNKLKALWTHYSPDFLLRHFLFRYPIEGTLNSFEQKESGDHSIGRYMKNAIPVLGPASRAIFAENAGRTATGEAGELQQYWREMRQAGGSMTFRSMRDTDMLKEHLTAKLNSLRRSPLQTVKDKHQAAVEAMDTVTNALDNSLRLAAYASARRQGKTPEQAAVIARDATVDFQMVGKWKNAIGLWFPFGNVAIQTGARMTSGVARSRIMRRVFMGTMLAGFLSGMFNYLIGGDDKDGIPFFDKIPEWDRHLNFIIMNPGHHDEKGRPVPIKIPLPYNWAFPYVMGSAFSTMIFGKDKHSIRKMLGLITRAGVEVATPFGQEDNMAAMLAPELARPFVHAYTNKDWNGSPVHKDETFQKAPNSYSPRKSTGDGWNYIAQSANNLTGGDKHHAGALDFYPEDLRLMFDYIGGSQRRLAENVATTATNAVAGKSPDYTHIPLARVIMGTDYDAADRSRRFERMKEAKQPWKR